MSDEQPYQYSLTVVPEQDINAFNQFLDSLPMGQRGPKAQEYFRNKLLECTATTNKYVEEANYPDSEKTFRRNQMEDSKQYRIAHFEQPAIVDKLNEKDPKEVKELLSSIIDYCANIEYVARQEYDSSS